MRSKFWYGVLGMEAVLFIFLCLSKVFSASAFPAIMAFPFESIGLGLRMLSLSGAFGNLAAIVLYTGLSLVPLGVLYILNRKGRLRGEDTLLVLLSMVLFAVLYLMVNPGDITSLFGTAMGAGFGKAALGGMVYSVLAGYLVLRVLRQFFDSGTGKLQRYLGIMMHVLNAIFIFAIFGSGFSGLLDAWESLRAGNQGNEELLGLSYVFLVIQYLVSVIPLVMNIVIVMAAGRLISDVREDRYSEASIASVSRLSCYCRNALVITILSQILFNILQLLFARHLMVMNSQVSIPVLSVVFVLAILLISRFLSESKQLKDDNDMII